MHGANNIKLYLCVHVFVVRIIGPALPNPHGVKINWLELTVVNYKYVREQVTSLSIFTFIIIVLFMLSIIFRFCQLM
jgi:hypothetical protein